MHRSRILVCPSILMETEFDEACIFRHSAEHSLETFVLRKCCMALQEVANALQQTLNLPSILPHGMRVDPTADGFLLQLPTSKNLSSSTKSVML